MTEGHPTPDNRPDASLAGGVLTINLGALAANYRTLRDRSAPADTAAVVKADGYGLGIDKVVPALAKAGCRTFFVALPLEGIAARQAAPDATIYVLSGPMNAEAATALRTHNLIPVLNSPHDIAIWRAECADGPLPAALHVDTGMNRLGLTLDEARAFASSGSETDFPLALVMSHLACADDPHHPLSRQQLETFQKVRALFPGVESSLANSAGIHVGGNYLCDLTRAGVALYGAASVNDAANEMRPVVTAQARILQVRRASAGSRVGYGATMRLAHDTVLAITACGYADGYHRAASGSGVPLRDAVQPGGYGFVAGKRVPIVGRVSMDLTAFDVSQCAGSAQAGDMIELFGPNIPIDDAAKAAGTIGYELLTGLGRRFHRTYLNEAG